MTDFGRDISCTDSLSVGRLVSGPRLVAEACYRRLSTPRGMLRGGEDEANYGFDLVEVLGTTTTKNTAASLEGRIRAELLKDPRVESVDVAVTDEPSGVGTTYEIVIAGVTADGPFDLTIAASAVTVDLLGISVPL